MSISISKILDAASRHTHEASNRIMPHRAARMRDAAAYLTVLLDVAQREQARLENPQAWSDISHGRALAEGLCFSAGEADRLRVTFHALSPMALRQVTQRALEAVGPLGTEAVATARDTIVILYGIVALERAERFAAWART